MKKDNKRNSERNNERYHLRKRECPNCKNKLQYIKTIPKVMSMQFIFKCLKCAIFWFADNWKDNRNWDFYSRQIKDYNVDDCGLAKPR